MSPWSCQQCTLVNSEANTLCAACGSEREQRRGTLLPRIIIKPISDVTNAILDLFNGPPNPVSRQRSPNSTFSPGSSSLRSSSSYPDLSSSSTPSRPAPPRPPPPGWILDSDQSSSRINPSPDSIATTTSTTADSSFSFVDTSVTSTSSHDGSLTWICRKCLNANPELLNVCSQCNERKSIGSKRRQRGQNRHLSYTSSGLSTENSSFADVNVSANSSTMSADEKMTSLCSEVMTEVERHDRENAAATYNSIVSFCGQHKTFIDDSFPHTQKSIGDLNDSDLGAVVGFLPTSFIWLRPEQMFTKDGRAWPWTVFRDPRSSDIEQGVLGDCWLLSAMALIAERPDVLEHILLTKEYSHCGVYQVRLCIDGQWKIVLVDDFFPCRPETRSIAFADGRKNQLWVPLIEKALAKQLGSYSRLRAGRTIEGLAMLTGAPVEVVSLEDETDRDIRWARILSAREAGFIMGCSCGAGKRAVNEEVFRRNGLLAKHAYSVLDVRQEGEHRLLRLRNPWGSFVWKGKWSNNWNGWPQDLKRKLLSGEPSTGTFWISYDDFLSHFDSVDIAKIRWYQGWAELRIPIQMGGEFMNSDRAVRILIEEPTEVCLTLFQGGARTAHDQVDLLICVHMVSTSGTIGDLICRSARKLEAFVSTGDVFLRSGQYIIVCHSLTTLGTRKIHGCLAIHSSKPMFADMVPCPPAVYTDSLVQLALKEGKLHSSLNGVFPRYITENFSGLLLMVDNVLEDMWVHVKVECSNSTNVLSSRGTLDVADSIPPLSRQIIMILTHFEPTQTYLVQHQLLVRVSHRHALGDFTIVRNGARTGSESHSPPFGCPAIEQLHSRKALFYC
ncbi:hypothetical protein Y032_0127g1413 [Ancylostoma ceylanicum]|nr:hypothetical protein Y032_0127g1413 [Ancylostoma ceylanicum]